MSEFQFRKSERLKSRKAISELFENGRSVYSYPVKVLYKIKWNEAGSKYPVKCGFSVAKKNFKLAVDRNFLKRRMREAYRLHKNSIFKTIEKKPVALDVFFIYIAKDKLNYFKIEQAIYRTIEQLNDELASA